MDDGPRDAIEDDLPRVGRLHLPYLVDNVDDVPPDFRQPDWREFVDRHPEENPEEVDRFMRLVEEGS